MIIRCGGLSKVPKEVLECGVGLKVLDLSHNRFTFFPKEIMVCSQLRTLCFDNNEIESIPPEISQLQQLETLSLSCNYIHSIERNLTRLLALKALLLHENNLQEWPAWLCSELQGLERLLLDANANLTGIPYTFAQMQKLSEFSFDWYCYLQPSSQCSAETANGCAFIDLTRQACLHYESQALTTNKMRITSNLPIIARDCCTFTEFMAWFQNNAAMSTGAGHYNKGRTALHLAAIWGHVAVVKELLSGASELNANALDADGLTALSLAVSRRRIEVAKLLLSSEHVNAGVVSTTRGTPLHIAVANGMMSLAELILAKAPTLAHMLDSNGNTPLHYVFAKFSTNIAQAAVLADALINKYNCSLNLLNYKKLSPLHCAAKRRQEAAIKFALAHNKKFHELTDRCFRFMLPGGKRGFTALHYLAVYCSLEMVQLCLHEAPLDVLAEDYQGRRARELVQNTAMAKLLLRHEIVAVRRIVNSYRHLSTPAFLPSGTAKLMLRGGSETEVKARLGTTQLDPTAKQAENSDTPIHIPIKTFSRPLILDSFHQAADHCFPPPLQTRTVSVRCDRLNNKSGKGPVEYSRHRLLLKFNPKAPTPGKNESPKDPLLGETTSTRLPLEDQARSELAPGQEHSLPHSIRILVDQCVSTTTQYCILYHIFKLQDENAFKTLQSLSVSPTTSMALKADAIYLLGLLKGNITSQGIEQTRLVLAHEWQNRTTSERTPRPESVNPSGCSHHVPCFKAKPRRFPQAGH